MLQVSKVSRSLERKLLIFWLEITDIFFLVILCSVLNLFFGGTSVKVYLVYLPTLICTISLILIKKGRPDGFILHFLRYHLGPKNMTCFHLGPLSFSLSHSLEERQREKKWQV